MIGYLSAPLVAANDQKWTTDAFRFWRGMGRSIPLELTAVVAYLRSPAGAKIDLNPVISGNEFSFEQTLEFMGALVPGDYPLEIQYTDDANDTRQLRGAVQILAGL